MTIRKLWIFLLVTSLAVNSKSEDYCCEFESENACDWTDAGADLGWVWSGISAPDSTSDPDFQPVSAYMWLQTEGDGVTRTGVITSTQLLIGDGDVLSFDEYVLSASSMTSLALIFRDNLGREVQLVSIGSTASWYHYTSTCGAGANSCCVTYPCIGWIDVVGTVTTSQDLVAFDNMTLNNCPVIVTTTVSLSQKF